jgi:hypothetical protein
MSNGHAIPSVWGVGVASVSQHADYTHRRNAGEVVYLLAQASSAVDPRLRNLLGPD